jgi:peptidoglycan/LPS O-acetylase OafA/YrhL
MMKQIKGLDTLRAFAVLAVVITHFGIWFNGDASVGKFIASILIPPGGFGVNLFFVLSGFLITGILLNAKENKVGKAAIIKNFYARRALRIFPIYYLLLFVLAAINYPDVRNYFWYFATYTSNILCYHTEKWNAYSHTWTLSVEEQFYLLWPWLMVLVNNKYIRYVLGAAVAIGVITPFIGQAAHPARGPLLVFHSFDAFGLGGMLAWAIRDADRMRWFRITIKILAVPALAIFFYWRILDYYEKWFTGIFLIKPCQDVISAWLIMLVLENRSALVGKYLLGNRVLNYIGRISYGLYLYHFPYSQYFRGKVDSLLYGLTQDHHRLSAWVHDHALNYWIHIAIIIGISALSFELIERPLLRLKDHFRYNASEPAFAPLAGNNNTN